MNANIRIRTDEKVIYPDLSYMIIGATYQVFNDMGYGLSEQTYQKAFAKELETRNITFKREQLATLQYKGEPVARFFLDFVLEEKIVVELKVRSKLGYAHIKQVMNYLKATGLKLAILIYFTRDGVKYRRVLNAS